jgi:DNA-directed RNA polymerase specialized sigma24 family protein
MTLTTHRLPHDGDGYSEALDYDRLPEPWREWAKIAKNFIWQLDDQWDKEDLMHNIIVRIAEVAEEYRRQGKSLTKGGCIKVAQYARLRFYHQKKRWKRVSSINLNSIVQDEDGNETEMIQTIVAKKGIDMDTWLDFKNYYQSRPQKERRAVRKLVRENWRNLSGYDWKQIKQFRADAKIALT